MPKEPSRVRFSIRSLMIVIAVAAGMLAVIRSPTALAAALIIALGLCFLATMGGTWWMFRKLRHLSALCFSVVGALSNAFSAAACIYWHSLGGFALILIGWVVAVPIMIGTGVAWANSATQPAARSRRPWFVAWPLVMAVALLPLSMLVASWPFGLAFRVSRPALEQLADRVAAGDAVTSPEWAGAFRVVGSVVDPSSGNVGLITDRDSSGCSGFVRARAALDPAARVGGPFHNLFYDVRLDDRWSYESED